MALIDATVVPGTRATIYTDKGPVHGVFGRKPIHLQKGEERTRPRFDLKEMWIDTERKTRKLPKSSLRSVIPLPTP
jgi:putative aminopeptidase FrvX